VRIGSPLHYFRDEIDFTYGYVASMIYLDQSRQFMKGIGMISLSFFLLSFPMGSIFTKRRGQLLLEGTCIMSTLLWFYHKQRNGTLKILEHTVEKLGDLESAISGGEADIAHNLAKRGFDKYLIGSNGDDYMKPPPWLSTQIQFLKGLRQKRNEEDNIENDSQHG